MTSAADGDHTAKQFSPDIVPAVDEEERRFNAWLHRVRTARLLPTDPAWQMTQQEREG